jgi:hypothetical protein
MYKTKVLLAHQESFYIALLIEALVCMVAFGAGMRIV